MNICETNETYNKWHMKKMDKMNLVSFVKSILSDTWQVDTGKDNLH